MRFYVRPEFVRGQRIYIRGKEQHHVRDVMRLDIGDEVIAFDGKGTEYQGVIEESSSREVIVRIERTSASSRRLPKITLGVSIPKLDKMDLIVQKSTELGVDTIVPILSERTMVTLDDRKAKLRMERWQKIAIEASKQSGRAELPKIETIMDFSDALSLVRGYDLALMPTLEKGTVPLQGALKTRTYKNAIAFIGPEGDFTAQEVSEAIKAGCVCVSLGPLVLRVETAALSILSILFYELSS